MFLKDFDTPAYRFEKIQSYLREHYNCEIAAEHLNHAKITKLIEQTKVKLSKLDEKTNPKEYSKMKLISEGLQLWKISPVQTELTQVPNMVVNEAIDDENVESAKVIIAVEDMTDKLQKIIQDLAEMQVQQLIPIVDSMKAELGAEQATRFNDTVDAALGELVDLAKTTKDAVTNAILVASGQETGSMDTMGMDTDMGPDMGPDMVSDMGDEFGGVDSAAGDMGPENRRLKGESIRKVMPKLSENKKLQKRK